MKLRNKIAVAGLAPLGLAIVLAFASVICLTSLIQSNTDKSRSQLAIQAGQNLERLVGRLVGAHQRYMITGRESDAAGFETAFEELTQEARRLRVVSADDAGQMARLTGAEATLGRWHSEILVPQLMERAKVQGAGELYQLLDEIKRSESAALEGQVGRFLADFVAESRRQLAMHRSEASDTAGITRNLIIWGTVAILPVAIFLSFLLASSITRRVSSLLTGVKRVAGGELSAEIDMKGGDEISALGVEFNLMVQALVEAQEQSKRDEEEKRRLQKMESIGQLAAGIAHEINTPTQYVGDNTRFLQTAFDDLDPVLAKSRELIAAVELGDEKMEQLATELSDAIQDADVEYLAEEIPQAIDGALEGVSRVSKIVRAMNEFAHPGEETKTNTDLNHAIENTVTLATNEWRYVADMDVDLDPHLPLIPVLAGGFKQVLLNLIVNAAHAVGDVVGESNGSERGKIAITTRRDGGFAEVRVSDTGSGIPESVQERIFDPFFTTKEVGKGSGQGLSIAHSVIVNQHGGTLSFETAKGQGTTFIIRLPVKAVGSGTWKANPEG